MTDRNGTRYAGMLSGQFASRTVKRATERFLCERPAPRIADAFAWRGPRAFIDYLTTAIREAYIAEGALSRVEEDWKVRAGCTVMAAIHVGDRIEIVAVGDSGIRVNGSDLLQVLKPLRRRDEPASPRDLALLRGAGCDGRRPRPPRRLDDVARHATPAGRHQRPAIPQ